ncbi:MAG: hypothetical protein V4568_19210 [Pseudomonadota bacterium]
MVAPIGKSPDDLGKLTASINTLGSAYQNYIAARTAIRDYVISVNEKYYAQVEQHIALAIENLGQAKLVAEGNDAQETVLRLLNAVSDWGVIAGQVHAAFASYQETVQSKILANFSTLSDTGNALVRLNALLMTGVLLDLQAAHAAVTSYLGNGQDTLIAAAYSSMNSAKTRINQAERGDKDLQDALHAFSVSLDTYVDGLRKAVIYREKAHRLFNEDLAPLGAKTQAHIEDLHRQSIEQQRNRSGGQ